MGVGKRKKVEESLEELESVVRAQKALTELNELARKQAAQPGWSKAKFDRKPPVMQRALVEYGEPKLYHFLYKLLDLGAQYGGQSHTAIIQGADLGTAKGSVAWRLIEARHVSQDGVGAVGILTKTQRFQQTTEPFAEVEALLEKWKQQYVVASGGRHVDPDTIQVVYWNQLAPRCAEGQKFVRMMQAARDDGPFSAAEIAQHLRTWENEAANRRLVEQARLKLVSARGSARAASGGRGGRGLIGKVLHMLHSASCKRVTFD